MAILKCLTCFLVLSPFLACRTTKASLRSLGRGLEPGEYPSVCRVVTNDGECSGVLVRSDLVLTAAHCLYNLQTAGSPVTLEVWIQDRQFSAKKFGVNSHFTTQPIDVLNRHDFGLIQLTEHSSVDPVPIATRLPNPREDVYLVGWGKFLDDDPGTAQAARMTFHGSEDGMLKLEQNIFTESGEFDGVSLRGDSGGAYFNKEGQLVGIHVGEVLDTEAGIPGVWGIDILSREFRAELRPLHHFICNSSPGS